MLACLRMLLAYRGTDVSEATLVGQAKLEEGGLNPEELAQLARRYGLAMVARPLNLADVAAAVERRQFPIVLIERTFLDREFTVHAVIPIRVSGHFVTFLDPLWGSRRVSRRKFEQAQRRVAAWAIAWVADATELLP